MILRMDNLLLAMWPPENLPECHGYPACYVILLLSTLPWNHCPFCRGITVHFGAEYAAKVSIDDWGTMMELRKTALSAWSARTSPRSSKFLTGAYPRVNVASLRVLA